MIGGQRGIARPARRVELWLLMMLTSHPVIAVLILSFLVRVLFILIVSPGASSAFGVGDDATYSFLAEGMATGRSGGWDPYARELYNGTATFTVPLTVIHLAFGSVEIGGPLLAATFGALAAALVTRLALEVLPTAWALAAGLTVAFFPSQVLWSSLTLKDSAVWAVLAGLAVLIAIGNRSSGRRLIWAVVGVIVVLLLVGHLRPHTFIVASWATALAALFSDRSLRIQRSIGAFLIAAAIPWVLGLGPAGLTLALNQDLEYRRTANAFGAATAFVPAAPIEEPVTQELESLQAEASSVDVNLESTLRAIKEIAAAGDSNAAAGDSNAASSSLRKQRRLRLMRERLRMLRVERAEVRERLEEAEARAAAEGSVPANEEDGVLSPMVQHLPKGLSVMLLEPYPWQATANSRVRLAQLESFLWYPLLALALAGLLGLAKDKKGRRALAFPVIAGGGILLVYALAEGNFGTAYRHRGEFVWVVVVLAAMGGRVVARTLADRRRQV